MKKYLCVCLFVFFIISMSTIVLAGGNSGNITQIGNENNSELYQYGSGNQITQTQNGAYNYAYAYQKGNNNVIIQCQENNRNHSEARQYGNGNTIEQYGYGNSEWIAAVTKVQGRLPSGLMNLQMGNNNRIVNCQGLTGIPVNIIQNGNDMTAFIH